MSNRAYLWPEPAGDSYSALIARSNLRTFVLRLLHNGLGLAQLPQGSRVAMVTWVTDLLQGRALASCEERVRALRLKGRELRFLAVEDIPTDELIDQLRHLRGTFMWENLRRERLYARTIPLYLYDAEFCYWLRSVDDRIVQEWQGLFLDEAPQARVFTVRSRLAMLRPMPLAILRAYHLYRCSRTNVLAACATFEDIEVEYATMFCALHACRRLAEHQRFGTTAPRVRTDGDKAVEPVAELPLLSPAIARSWGQLVDRQYPASEIEVPSRPFISRRCPRCHDQRPDPLKLGKPPYRSGCTCELRFDPENDPFVEAPLENDIAPWRAQGAKAHVFPQMRVLLRAAELARTTVCGPPSMAHSWERARFAEWLQMASAQSSALAALAPRLLFVLVGRAHSGTTPNPSSRLSARAG